MKKNEVQAYYLKNLLKEKGIDYKKLLDLLSDHEVYVSEDCARRWCKGENFPAEEERLEALAEILNTSVLDLECGGLFDECIRRALNHLYKYCKDIFKPFFIENLFIATNIHIKPVPIFWIFSLLGIFANYKKPFLINQTSYIKLATFSAFVVVFYLVNKSELSIGSEQFKKIINLAFIKTNWGYLFLAIIAYAISCILDCYLIISLVVFVFSSIYICKHHIRTNHEI